MSLVWAVDLTLIPLIGYGLTYSATEYLKEPCGWLDEAAQPWWALEYERETLYFSYLVGSNLAAGVSSVLMYVVSMKAEQSARVDLDRPLGLYFGQVLLWWLHYPLVHYLCSLPLGLIDIAAAGVASGAAAFCFARYSPIAAGLLLPYVALMWYHVTWDAYTLWNVFRDSRRTT